MVLVVGTVLVSCTYVIQINHHPNQINVNQILYFQNYIVGTSGFASLDLEYLESEEQMLSCMQSSGT
jgi:hypothetical protein